MDRRGAAVGVLLLLAALLVIAGPKLLEPVGIEGSGVAAAMPPPPGVGACLRTDAITVKLVSCDEPHIAEVTASWAADDLDRWALGTEKGCNDAGRLYIDYEPSFRPDWYAYANVQSGRIDAPPSERVRTRGWTVCTVAAGSGTLYTGSLRDISVTERPAATSTCFQDDSSPNASRFVVSCDQRHRGEDLATTWREVPDPDRLGTPVTPDGSVDPGVAVPLPADLMAQITGECTAVAATLVGSDDPTRGGELAVVTRAESFYPTSDDPSVATAVATCTIEPTENRWLVGSVVGLGDAAVPFE